MGVKQVVQVCFGQVTSGLRVRSFKFAVGFRVKQAVTNATGCWYCHVTTV